MAKSVHRYRTVVTVVAVVAGLLARLLTASAGDNYDMESWWIASEGVLRGEPVYAATHRYNYGPLWSYCIGALRWISAATGPDTITRLHLFMTTLLTLPDLLLAYILSRTVGWQVGVLFFLNPISCFVTGYHVQFDNLAIVLGIVSWIVFQGASSRRSLFLAAVLLGASLSIKHVFAPFLAWIPLCSMIRNLSARVVYLGAALVIFIASFAPWVGDPEVWASIQRNVFEYRSTEGYTVTSIVASWLGVSARQLFILLTIAAGCVLVRFTNLQRFAPQLYLLALVGFSSGMARNYLAIPLIAVFAHRSAWPAQAYLLIGTLAFVTVNTNLGSTEVAYALLTTPLVSYELCQLLLLGTFISVLRSAARSRVQQ